MVKKEQSKRQKSIKSKLLAAVCMLLVSCIMMVSSTYAWFTLSTAPEVTGITTSVGANGNLEMALQPLDGNSANITSGTGDSMYGAKAVNLANLTWGNLVNLSDNSYYGLNKIKLYPAQLNTEANANNGLKLKTNYLSTPEYGADGRVAGLVEKTISGTYDTTEENFYEKTGIAENAPFGRGVRAIGVSSSMSERQLAFRAALSSASTIGNQAKVKASQSLNNNGAKLADIAIQHATWESSNGTETYDDTDLNALLAIINDLLGTDPNAVDGSLEYIKEALKQYCIALAVNAASDDQYQTAKSNVESAATLAGMNTTGNAVMTTALGKLQTAFDNVNAAKTAIENLKANTGRPEGSAAGVYTWTEIAEPILYKLANPNTMQINTIAVTDLNKNYAPPAGVTSGTFTDPLLPRKTYTVEAAADGNGYVCKEDGDIVTNMSRLVSSVLNQGINLILESGSGVYSDIADFCGDYSASIVIEKISYGGMKVDDLEADMKTKTTVTNSDDELETYLSQVNGEVGAFRAGTGGGSSRNAISDFYGYIIDLAFRTNAADSYLQLQSEAIDRIYSDGTNPDTMGHGASMTFTTADTNFSGASMKELMKAIRIVFFNTDTLDIIGYARLDSAKATTDAATGAITMPMALTNADGNLLTNVDTTTYDDTKVIMALTQNQIHELSVMVYLDGATVGNDDVANAASSMTGSMNIQFSSSATLHPMDYSDLKSGDGGDTLTPSYTATNVTVSTITDGYAATIKHITDGTNHKLVAVVTKDGAPVTSGVTVQIGSANATYQTVGIYSGWIADSTATAPTEAVTVSVTVTGG